jgi:hypothetical protein
MARKSREKAAPPRPVLRRGKAKAAAKAGARTENRASRARGGNQSGRLIPEVGEVIVRMYRQGLGDCFLLAFAPADRASPCYVLIDCGVHARQDDGPHRMKEVMDDLKAATAGRIDVVVATHEHADHLSGFVQKGSPFLDGSFQISQVWLAWTEKPGDPRAEALRRRRNAARETIRRAVEKLKSNDSNGLDRQLAGLVDFETIVGAAPELAVDRARTSRRKGPRARASASEVALEMLVEEVGTANVRYCEPGQPGPSLPGVKNVHVHVLGPPRDEALLKKDLPTGGSDDPRHETYLAGRPVHLAFMNAPSLDHGDPFGQSQRLGDDLRYPFDITHRRKYRVIGESASRPGRARSGADREHFRAYDNYFRQDAWRRIETDWLGAAEALALDLDGDTNNTSLVLAFERGQPGEGDVLLFVGDAQVGNWLSWRQQTYRVRGGPAESAEDLLARTVLYKVGHHGSHNGTAKIDSTDSTPERPSGQPFGLELMPNRLVALVPVDRAAATKPMPRPWHMPHPPLYRRLLQKAGGRVLSSDSTSPEAPPDNPDGLRAAAPSGSAWSPVPGLSGCRWREAPVTFRRGDQYPLYYDVALGPG